MIHHNIGPKCLNDTVPGSPSQLIGGSKIGPTYRDVKPTPRTPHLAAILFSLVLPLSYYYFIFLLSTVHRQPVMLYKSSILSSVDADSLIHILLKLSIKTFS